MNVETIFVPISENKWKKTACVPEQVIAIGGFDGVHVGHQQVLTYAVERAQANGWRAAAMTFHPHPRSFFGQRKYDAQLTPVHRKIELLRQYGIETVYIVQFEEQFAQLTPEQFVEDILLALRCREVVVGYNFTFGRGGLGTGETLRTLARDTFEVHVVEQVTVRQRTVSSTQIRLLLQEAKMENVTQLLGEPYTVSGTVVTGAKRGRTLGFPTANVELDAMYVVPAWGVYVVQVQFPARSSEWSGGVLNVGVRPTIGGDAMPTWEVHVLVPLETCYGESMRIQLLHYLREERKFHDVEQLQQQIQSDVAEARRLLSDRFGGTERS